ncbi:MAG: hypothetical protein ISS01_01930 [Nanoarchaeota archaeon]|nr:hypothetical protein [Nanoarchaeota archaeon]
MLIATDWDDVGVECFRPFVEFFNELNGTSVKYEDLNSYYEMYNLFGMGREMMHKTFNEFYDTGMMNKITAIEGSEDLYQSLKDKGHELIVITSRPVIRIDDTLEQIERLIPGLISEVYFTDLPFIDNGRGSKKDICKTLGVDVLIEDCYENLESCLPHLQKGFLLKRPWNRNIAGLPRKVTRVEDPREILKYI